MWKQALETLNFISILDILIVAFVIYKLMMIIKGTRAVQLIKGLFVLLLASLVSETFGFTTVAWILDQFSKVCYCFAHSFSAGITAGFGTFRAGKVFCTAYVHVK